MAKKENKPEPGRSALNPVPSLEDVAAGTGTPQPRKYAPEEDLGERMRQRRNELKLNYEQLARLTASYDAPEYKKGLSAAMLARYEKGVGGRPVFPGARELRLLCDALGVSADWLLYGRNLDPVDDVTSRIANAAVTLVKTIENYAFLMKSRGPGGDSMERATKLYHAVHGKPGETT